MSSIFSEFAQINTKVFAQYNERNKVSHLLMFFDLLINAEIKMNIWLHAATARLHTD